jgi:release factor glutamine methyltransferase
LTAVAEQALALARKAADVFQERGLESARLEAELLLAHVLGMKRLDLYLQFDRPVTEVELEAFRSAVRRRLRREPLQYILGEASFRGVTLHVDRRVLIPRPETEVLAGAVLEWAASQASSEEPRTVLDVGTGSGALAIALVAEGGFAAAVATDVSPGALEVAAQNAQRAGVTDRIALRCGDLWVPLAPGERFDAIVSNPPYVAESERAQLAPEIREWEPPEALFAGADGLRVMTALVDGAADRLRPGGLLALEVGLGQAAAVAQRVLGAGFADARIVRDLSGRERIVLGISDGGGSRHERQEHHGREAGGEGA